MKNTVTLLLLITASTLFSCSGKDKQLAPYKPDYYFRFKVDDSLITHKGLAWCSLKPNFSNPSVYDFLMSSSTNTSVMTFALQKNTEITRGTYTVDADPASINAEYYLVDGWVMYSLNTLMMPPAPFSISITEIDEKYIRGTFTGNYMYNEARTDSFRISAGEFLVRRTK